MKVRWTDFLIKQNLLSWTKLPTNFWITLYCDVLWNHNIPIFWWKKNITTVFHFERRNWLTIISSIGIHFLLHYFIFVLRKRNSAQDCLDHPWIRTMVCMFLLKWHQNLKEKKKQYDNLIFKYLDLTVLGESMVAGVKVYCIKNFKNRKKQWQLK